MDNSLGKVETDRWSEKEERIPIIKCVLCVILIRSVESGAMLIARSFQTKPGCIQKLAENKSNNLPTMQFWHQAIWKSLKKQGAILLAAFVSTCPLHCSLSSSPQTQWHRPGNSQCIPGTAGGASSREEGSTPVGLTHSERLTSLLEDLTVPLTYSENLQFVCHLEIRRQFRIRKQGN